MNEDQLEFKKRNPMLSMADAMRNRLESPRRPKDKITNQRQEVIKMFLDVLNPPRVGRVNPKTGKLLKPLTAGYVASRMASMSVSELRQFYGYCKEGSNFSSTWWWKTNPKNYA